ncbi:MAG: efflux RND transporter periplasmic adaptor subunit, partial [Cytophagales bacterium]|nr:efflux RND transporter periplasmic adaptor subunit [Cytophagales bacterium]
MRLKKSMVCLVWAILTLWGCSTEKKAEVKKSVGYLEMDKKQLESMDIQVSDVVEKDIRPVIYANGFVGAKPNLEAKVTSNISGRIEKIYVLEGSIVRKGEPLMSISSMEFIQVQQDYMKAYQDALFLEKVFTRQAELRKADVGSVADFQSIESRYYAAISMEKALRSKLSLLGVNADDLKDPKTAQILFEKDITSPISGYVYALPVSIGTRADLGVILANIIDLSELHADIYCYEKDLDKIAEDEAVEIEFVNKNIPKVAGKIRSIERSLDESSRSITIHALFKAPKGYLVVPEMAIQAKILSNISGKPSIAVPSAAVFEESDYSYIFLVQPTSADKFKVEKIKVKVGNSDGSMVEVFPFNKEIKGMQVASLNVFALDTEYK